MKLKLVGSDLFTGGSFGPEAGIACTIVLFVAIIILLYKIKNSYEKSIYKSKGKLLVCLI